MFIDYLELSLNQIYSIYNLMNEIFLQVFPGSSKMLTSKSRPEFKLKLSDNNNQHIRVLHVDDDEDFLNMSKVFLEKFGKEKIHVNSLNDPKKIIEILKMNEYDIIISDYYMPQEMNCIRMLDEIRNAGITLPFIVLTGTAKKEDVINGLNNGADCVIQKGIDIKSQFTELVFTINKIINQKQSK